MARCRLQRSAMVAQDNGVGGPAAAAAQMEGLSMANGAGQMVAVGEARTVLPRPDLSGIKGVDTQTHAIGIIHPPPDIRAIVDKTAQFVARNGACRGPACLCSLGVLCSYAQGAQLRRPACCCAGLSFEKKILANEEKNVKFNFLRPTDPYHAYYRAKASPRRLSWCPNVCVQRRVLYLLAGGHTVEAQAAVAVSCCVICVPDFAAPMTKLWRSPHRGSRWLAVY